MTTAIEQAAEAIVGMIPEDALTPHLQDEIKRAVGEALTAERAAVPPDRERLAQHLIELADGKMAWSENAVEIKALRDAAAALRSPTDVAPARERLAQECADAAENLSPSRTYWVSLLLDRVAAALRSPADGWRTIESAPKDGRADFWLEWSDDCAPLNDKPLGQSTWAYEQLFRGKFGCWPGYCKATRWMPLPSPPAEETKTP